MLMRVILSFSLFLIYFVGRYGYNTKWVWHQVSLFILIFICIDRAWNDNRFNFHLAVAIDQEIQKNNKKVQLYEAITVLFCVEWCCVSISVSAAPLQHLLYPRLVWFHTEFGSRCRYPKEKKKCIFNVFVIASKRKIFFFFIILKWAYDIFF